MKPAVTYLRMSTDRQDKSIAQQREELDQLAQQMDCTILRDYKDEGISGDATEKLSAAVGRNQMKVGVGFRILMVF